MDGRLVPFPTVRGSPPGEVQEILYPDVTPNLQDSVIAETQSSKLTSSDKLSALPYEQPLPRGTQPPWRNNRHSLDLETIRHDSWGTHRGRIHSRLSHHDSRQTSPSHDTPKRISFDSDRGSQPGVNRRGFGQQPHPPAAFPSKLGPGARASDSSVSPNPQTRQGRHIETPNRVSAALPGSPPVSRPPSRAASPLRMLHQWSSNMHRTHRPHKEFEPFVPVNPFKFRRRKKKFTIAGLFSPPPSPSSSLEMEAGSPSSGSSGVYGCDVDVVPVTTIKAFFEDAQMFITDSLPRQLYLNILLRIPAMYFSRVARIFEDAEVSRPDIQRMIDAMCKPSTDGKGNLQGAPGHPTVHDHAASGQTGVGGTGPGSPTSHDASIFHLPLPFPDEWTPTSVSPSLFRFKHSWEAFIDSLIREWKTLNVVSALLSSAIVSIFQVPEAAEDPITRTLALLSLVSALMSLSYGCMYIVRFASMRSMFRASKWAEEAQKTKTLIWWNVWVMLAMPAVWISWAMLFFFSSIMSFVWRTGSEADPPERPPLPRKAALGPRIAITFVFVLGMVYLLLIVRTLKRYGSGPQNGSVQGLLRAGSASQPTDLRAGPFRRDDGAGGEGSLHGHGLMLSRLVTPGSDASEQRGRKRQRMEPNEGSKEAKQESKQSTRKGDVLKGDVVKSDEDASSFDLKELGVVSVKLPDRSVESV